MRPKIAILLALSACTAFSGAATLDLAIAKYNSTAPTTNLTTAGNLDWAYWQSNVGTLAGTTLAPSNEKSGGTLISTISIVGTGSFRGSTTADAYGSYTYSDGTSPTSPSNTNLVGGLVFSSTLGTNGQGFSFTIAGDTSADRYVTLFAGGFASVGQLTLTLNNATTIVDTSQLFANVGPKQIAAYQIRFRPDNPGDNLTVSFVSSSNTDGNSHVGIETITVGTAPVIPEPSVAALAGLGGLALLKRRRSAAR